MSKGDAGRMKRREERGEKEAIGLSFGMRID